VVGDGDAVQPFLKYDLDKPLNDIDSKRLEVVGFVYMDVQV